MISDILEVIEGIEAASVNMARIGARIISAAEGIQRAIIVLPERCKRIHDNVKYMADNPLYTKGD